LPLSISVGSPFNDAGTVLFLRPGPCTNIHLCTEHCAVLVGPEVPMGASISRLSLLPVYISFFRHLIAGGKALAMWLGILALYARQVRRSKSPPVVTKSLNGNFLGLQIGPLPPDHFYSSPTGANATSCRCSSVYYSVIAACGFCQNRNNVKCGVLPSSRSSRIAEIDISSIDGPTTRPIVQLCI